MGSWGTAGASAREGYVSAASRRRRLRQWKWALVLASPAAGWLAYDRFHSGARLIILGLAGAVFLAATLWRPDPDSERWLRGSSGEIGTASALESLPSRRWHVFHDLGVPGSRANIDHLAVGRTGVWVIDTKSTRAPVRIRPASVRLGNRRLSTESVRWQAEVVSERLGVKARPLIALYCDGSADRSRIPRRGVKRGGVRVVLAADVSRRLRRGPRRLGRGAAESVAGEVLSVFGPAAGRDRQNEAGRQKRRNGSPTT